MHTSAVAATHVYASCSSAVCLITSKAIARLSCYWEISSIFGFPIAIWFRVAKCVFLVNWQS